MRDIGYRKILKETNFILKYGGIISIAFLLISFIPMFYKEEHPFNAIMYILLGIMFGINILQMLTSWRLVRQSKMLDKQVARMNVMHTRMMKNAETEHSKEKETLQ